MFLNKIGLLWFSICTLLASRTSHPDGGVTVGAIKILKYVGSSSDTSNLQQKRPTKYYILYP